MSLLIVLLFIEFCFHIINDTNKRRLDVYISHDAGIRIILLLIISFLDPYLAIFLSCLYLSSFNITFNLVNNKRIDYLGKEAITDKILRFIRINPVITYIVITLSSYILWIL